MRKQLKFWLGTLTVFLLALTPSVVPVGLFVDEAQATPNVGVGTVCEQTVGNTSGVSVTKLSSSDDCVVTFSSDNTWTPNAGIGSIEALVVAGGGGGGSGGWGGGAGACGVHHGKRE